MRFLSESSDRALADRIPGARGLLLPEGLFQQLHEDRTRLRIGLVNGEDLVARCRQNAGVSPDDGKRGMRGGWRCRGQEGHHTLGRGRDPETGERVRLDEGLELVLRSHEGPEGYTESTHQRGL